jgi:hypothetical protein
MLERLGNALAAIGDSILMKHYTKKYGAQIGKVSKSGYKAFCKVKAGKEVVTGLDRKGNVVSIIKRDIRFIKNSVGVGNVHTERFRDGKQISVTDMKLATNFRDIFTRFLDSSAVRKRMYLNNYGRINIERTRIEPVYSSNSNYPFAETTKTVDVKW